MTSGYAERLSRERADFAALQSGTGAIPQTPDEEQGRNVSRQAAKSPRGSWNHLSPSRRKRRTPASFAKVQGGPRFRGEDDLEETEALFAPLRLCVSKLGLRPGGPGHEKGRR